MSTPNRFVGAPEYVERLRVLVHDTELPASNRTRAAAACLAIAQEHHHSIVLLTEHRLYGSAFALVRVGFEAYLRGMWLGLCARGKQVGAFLRGAEPPKVFTLLLELEAKPAFTEKVLSAIKARHWQSMCAYTHTGGLHAQRWNTATAVEPNYGREEINQVLFFAELVGSLSAIGIATLADNDDLASKLFVAFKERFA